MQEEGEDVMKNDEIRLHGLLVGCVRLGHFGDGGMTATSARIIAAGSTPSAAPQCVRC